MSCPPGCHKEVLGFAWGTNQQNTKSVCAWRGGVLRKGHWPEGEMQQEADWRQLCPDGFHLHHANLDGAFAGSMAGSTPVHSWGEPPAVGADLAQKGIPAWPLQDDRWSCSQMGKRLKCSEPATSIYLQDNSNWNPCLPAAHFSRSN